MARKSIISHGPWDDGKHRNYAFLSKIHASQSSISHHRQAWNVGLVNSVPMTSTMGWEKERKSIHGDCKHDMIPGPDIFPKPSQSVIVSLIWHSSWKPIGRPCYWIWFYLMLWGVQRGKLISEQTAWDLSHCIHPSIIAVGGWIGFPLGSYSPELHNSQCYLPYHSYRYSASYSSFAAIPRCYLLELINPCYNMQSALFSQI